MPSKLLWLLCVGTSQAASVSYTLEVRDWVVDYQRPTTLPRQAPFAIPVPAKKAAVLANNSYPGPTLEAYEGETIEVTIVNQLLEAQFAMSFEGVQVQGKQGLIPQQGGKLTYLLTAQKPGTYWWHARLGQLAARGLKGALVVRSREEEHPKQYQEERLMALSEEWVAPEVCLDGSGRLLQGCPEIDRATLNGQWGDGSKAYPLPVVEVKKGTCYRLRFLGLMSQPRHFEVSIKDHAMMALGNSSGAPSVAVRAGEGADAVLCADKGTLLGGDYSINMTYVGQSQATSFFGILRYPALSKARAADPVGYI